MVVITNAVRPVLFLFLIFDKTGKIGIFMQITNDIFSTSIYAYGNYFKY